MKVFTPGALACRWAGEPSLCTGLGMKGWGRACLLHSRPWVWTPSPHKLDTVLHACQSSTWEGQKFKVRPGHEIKTLAKQVWSSDLIPRTQVESWCRGVYICSPCEFRDRDKGTAQKPPSQLTWSMKSRNSGDPAQKKSRTGYEKLSNFSTHEAAYPHTEKKWRSRLSSAHRQFEASLGYITHCL